MFPTGDWRSYKPRQRHFLENLPDNDFRELRNMVWKCWLKNLLFVCGPFLTVIGGAEICGRMQLIPLPSRNVRISFIMTIFLVAGAATATAPMTRCGEQVKLQLQKLSDKYPAGQLGEYC